MGKTVDEPRASQSAENGLAARFHELAKQWKEERNPYSSCPDEWAMCWSYQRIIGLGPAVVPLILSELRADPDYWFWALSALTGEDPVPVEARGQFSEMTKAWLAWGEQHCGPTLS